MVQRFSGSEVSVMPQVVLIAGPNGAGKTTASRSVLLQTYRVPTYVNPDIIA